MSNARRQYTNEMAESFGGYYAAWTPGDPLALGDYGVLQGSVFSPKAFTRIGNVADLGISFATRDDSTPETIGPYKSASRVSVRFKAAGAATLPNCTLAQADAGFSIQFTGEHATFFLAEGCYQPSVADQPKLGRDILAAFADGRWSKSWCVITQIVNASSMTVLISSSTSGAVDLKANGTISPTAGTGDLAKVALDLQLQYAQDMATTLVANAGATPMFKLSAVQKRLFGKPSFNAAKGKTAETRDLQRLPLDAITPAFLKNNPEVESYVSFGELTG